MGELRRLCVAPLCGSILFARSDRMALEHGRRALRQVLERGFRYGNNQESGRQGRERSVSSGFADAIQKESAQVDADLPRHAARALHARTNRARRHGAEVPVDTVRIRPEMEV